MMMMIIVMMNNDDDDDDECWLMSDGNGAFMGTLEPGSRLFSGKILKKYYKFRKILQRFRIVKNFEKFQNIWKTSSETSLSFR